LFCRERKLSHRKRERKKLQTSEDLLNPKIQEGKRKTRTSEVPVTGDGVWTHLWKSIYHLWWARGWGGGYGAEPLFYGGNDNKEGEKSLIRAVQVGGGCCKPPFSTRGSDLSLNNNGEKGHLKEVCESLNGRNWR